MIEYARAFSRNLGWTTDWEQASLQSRRIAIAGLGGVGGSHLLTLTRLGIGAFTLADFDRFDVANFNRQAGANAATVGRPKLEVMAEMARAINPALRLRCFPDGVTAANLDAFLDGVDLFVDGLDFFALDIRARVFARCSALGIPAITAAPIGMGVGFLAFMPGGQTFERYFRLAGQAPEEQALRFLLGMAPRGLHRSYLADDTRVDLAGKRGPSTAAACELCAGMVATQALKILLRRGGVPTAPVHLTMDAYRGRAAHTVLRWGQAGPLQRLKRVFARRAYRAMAARTAAPEPKPHASRLHAILDAARWAPSGDNTQPWTFEIVDESAVRIQLRVDPDNPYEYRDGEPAYLAGGMLLESLAIAASAHAMRLEWSADDRPSSTIDARFVPQPDLEPSPLLAALPMRSVVRGAMGSAPLTQVQRQALAAALGPDMELRWHQDRSARLAFAWLGARATDIRLRAAETFEVHRAVVDWARARSPVGLPSGAIGLNAPTLRLMRWGMADWGRMRRVNRVFGTGAASLQLDLWPALRSSAFFTIHMPAHRRGSLPQKLRAGMALQRFWLTATRLGLGLQPALATLIFAEHGLSGTPFTTDPALRAKAAALGRDVVRQLGTVGDCLFLGRLGWLEPGMPGPRSVRQPVEDMVVQPASDRRPVSSVGLRRPVGAPSGDE